MMYRRRSRNSQSIKADGEGGSSIWYSCRADREQDEEVEEEEDEEWRRNCVQPCLKMRDGGRQRKFLLCLLLRFIASFSSF